MAGGQAASVEGHALFLQQKLRQFEASTGSAVAATVGSTTTQSSSRGTAQTNSAAPGAGMPKPAKGRKKKPSKGGFLATLKQQAQATERKQKKGLQADALALDTREKQGQNQGIFSYLQPPMGH